MQGREEVIDRERDVCHMSRILNKSQTTKVMYSSDYPLKLVTNVNGVNIEFLLAPRIDQEV